MMIRSMTGFGRAERNAGPLRVGVEIKSLNHRHAEVRLKLPPMLSAMEEPLRNRLRSAVQRGRAEATVTLSGFEMESPVEVNHALIRGYLQAAGDVRKRHRLDGSVGLEAVLSLPGAVTLRQSDTQLSPKQMKAVESAFDAAVKELEGSRLREGRHLAVDLGRRFKAVERHRAAVLSRAKGASARWSRRVKERLAELEEASRVDPGRLAQEIAFLATRSDITEELVRLEGHLDQAIKLLGQSAEPVGRRLDFLLQEMHREANTINSKSEDLNVSRHALSIKVELEKIREQAQNLE